MRNITVKTLHWLLVDKFHGVLSAGAHAPGSKACALELLSVAQGIPWTDDPSRVRTFDLRPLNDIEVPEVVRTAQMLPVLARYANSLDWTASRQKQVGARLAILMVNRLIANLPTTSPAIAARCREAVTLEESEAAEAAEAAGESGVAAARKQVFLRACAIWLEAAKPVVEASHVS